MADDFEVPVEKLRKWNHLRGNDPLAGPDLGHLQACRSDSERLK